MTAAGYRKLQWQRFVRCFTQLRFIQLMNHVGVDICHDNLCSFCMKTMGKLCFFTTKFERISLKLLSGADFFK